MRMRNHPQQATRTALICFTILLVSMTSSGAHDLSSGQTDGATNGSSLLGCATVPEVAGVDVSGACPSWEHEYQPGGFGAATDAAVSADGSVSVVTGRAWPSRDVTTGCCSTREARVITIAYDSRTGKPLWQASEPVTNESRNIFINDYGPAYKITINAAQSLVHVAAFDYRPESETDVLILTYALTSGEEVWRTRVDGPESRSDVPSAIGVSRDGETVYMAGTANLEWDDEFADRGAWAPTDLETGDYLVGAYAASSGVPRWVSVTGRPWEQDWLKAMFIADDGDVVITGTSLDPSGSTQVVTVGYGGSTGARRWVQRFAGGPYAGYSTTEEGPFAFAPHLAGSGELNMTYVSLMTIVNGTPNTATGVLSVLAYDVDSGARMWRHNYDHNTWPYPTISQGASDHPGPIGVSPDGRTVVATGRWDDSGLKNATFAVVLDARNGDRMWTAQRPVVRGEPNMTSPTAVDDAFPEDVAVLDRDHFILSAVVRRNSKRQLEVMSFEHRDREFSPITKWKATRTSQSLYGAEPRARLALNRAAGTVLVAGGIYPDGSTIWAQRYLVASYPLNTN